MPPRQLVRRTVPLLTPLFGELSKQLSLLSQVREQVDDSASQDDLARVQEVQSSVNQVGPDRIQGLR